MCALPTLDDDIGSAETPADTTLTDPMQLVMRSMSSSASATEILRELRAAYPYSPLALRVRALAALQRR